MAKPKKNSLEALIVIRMDDANTAVNIAYAKDLGRDQKMDIIYSAIKSLMDGIDRLKEPKQS